MSFGSQNEDFRMFESKATGDRVVTAGVRSAKLSRIAGKNEMPLARLLQCAEGFLVQIAMVAAAQVAQQEPILALTARANGQHLARQLRDLGVRSIAGPENRMLPA